MTEKRFKEGDSITYLYQSDFPDNTYAFGGVCYGGSKGIINCYEGYQELSGCWRIEVTLPDGGFYTMLESEFKEYYSEITRAREIIYG